MAAFSTIAAVVSAVATVAATATSIATAGSNTPEPPPAPPLPSKLPAPPAQALAPAAPQVDEGNIKAQEARAQAVTNQRRSRTNTVLTSPIGAPQSAANLAKSVLGG